MNPFEKARSFIYRNARPLDLARWQYHFENGTKEAVLTALAAYQNEDGGFGHALEADSFNPNSCPLQTWQATEILREIEFTDKQHPILQGILRCLESGKDFDTEHKQGLNVVESNNDFPCAVWWKYGEAGSEFRYNPSACLSGFAIRYAEPDSKLYVLSAEIAKQAFDWFMKEAPFEEKHITSCFIRLYEYCLDAHSELFDPEKLRNKLTEQVNMNICRDTEKWGVKYVPLPSDFIRSKYSPFYEGNEKMVAEECRFIRNCQLPDGSYSIPWQWYNDYKEYEVAANWWKSDFIIRNMLFLKAFNELI